MPKATDSVTTHASAPRHRPAKLCGYAVGLVLGLVGGEAAASSPGLATGVLVVAAPGTAPVHFAACAYTNEGAGVGPCFGRGPELYRVALDFLPTQWFQSGREALYECADSDYYYPPQAICNGWASITLEPLPAPLPPGTPKLTDEQKKEHRREASRARSAAVSFGFAAAGFSFTGNKAAAFALAGITAVLLEYSNSQNDIANDPIDNNYTEIATVIIDPLPSGIAGKPCIVTGGASASGPAAFVARSIGIAKAVTTSQNRMQGAIAAGDTYWTAQQGQAMLAYAAQLEDKSTRVPLSTLFNCSNAQPAVSAATVLAWQQGIKTNGLPADLRSIYAELGASDAEINQATGMLYSADSTLVAYMYNAINGPIADRPVYWQALDASIP